MTRSTNKQSRFAWLRTWKGPAAAAGVLLLLFVWWLVPSKVDRVETVDGQHAWNASNAPARRLFVWAPAEHLDELALDGGSLIRPHLADGGGTLYFTLRRPDGTADVVRTRLAGGAWMNPEPAVEFNSLADDLGLVLRADGREAYFYSNRPGGFGGFDLYVSRRDDDGWTAPENLGGRVNTPAHEYDPAVSPDGLSLLFASNRTAEMQAALHGRAENDAAKPRASGEEREWSTTLRAHPGQSTFDLYRADRVAANADWTNAAPLSDLNRSDSNEGAPALAPGGMHVYFSSDRPGGSGGFDLYRAKLARPNRTGAAASEIENLGPSVNTAADDLEPGLSPEGFSLVFSSNRGEAGDAEPNSFALYRSGAVEVTEETGWDDTNWLAFAGVWWWAALVALGAALLVLMWIYSHRWVAETAVAFRFFLASLMFHLLLVLLLALTMIREQVLEIRQEIAEREEYIEVLPEAAPDEGLSAFDETADLASAEQAAAMQRAATSEPLARPDVPPRATISQELARKLPPELVVRVAPQPEVEPEETKPQDLARRAFELPRQVLPLDEAMELDAEPSPPESPADAAASDIARAAQTTPAQTTPNVKRPEVMQTPNPLSPARATELATGPPIPTALPRREAAEADDSIAAQLADDAAQLAAAELSADAPIGAAPAEERTMTAPAEGSSRDAVAALSEDSLPERMTAAAVASRSPSDREFEPNSATETRLPRSAVEAVLDSPLPIPADDAAMIAGQPAGDLVQLAAVQAAPTRDEAESMSAVRAAEAIKNASPLIGESPRKPVAIGPAGAAAAPKTDDKIVLARAASPAELAGVAELGEAAPAALAGEEHPGDSPLAGKAEAQRNADLPPSVASLTSAATASEVKTKNADTAGVLSRRSPLDAAVLDPAGVDPERGVDDFAAAEIEDLVSVRQMFALRSDERMAFIEEFGGTPESERAIELGLKWLAKSQKEDGRWVLQDHQGGVQSDAAAAGFALLPFLGQGKTHKKGEYQPTVEKGLKWLVDHQKPDGDLFTGGSGNAHMYSHGVAAIALCEAYGVTRDEALKAPAQKSLDFIVAAQHQQTGGWRYHPGEPGDTSVVGWQVMALKSGEMAGLSVPKQALDLSNKWLDSAEGKDAARGQFGYQGPGGSPAMTAEGLLCRQFLGASRRDPAMRAGADFLLARLPQAGQESSYYWYYATQVMYHMQGDHWQKWNTAIRDLLVKSQEQGGDHAGSWPPSDVWEQQGGRIYSTSLRLLMLEVYYRHLPLYRQLGP